jgi:hypothetical protein
LQDGNGFIGISSFMDLETVFGEVIGNVEPYQCFVLDD